MQGILILSEQNWQTFCWILAIEIGAKQFTEKEVFFCEVSSRFPYIIRDNSNKCSLNYAVKLGEVHSLEITVTFESLAFENYEQILFKIVKRFRLMSKFVKKNEYAAVLLYNNVIPMNE